MLIITSCSSTKYLKDKETILKSNKVVIDASVSKKERNIIKADLVKAARQKPNKKLFGFINIKLGFYNLAEKRRTKRLDKQKDPVITKFNKWMAEKVGEPPAVFDSLLVKVSEKNMKNLLANTGYLNATVESKYESTDRKTKVTYTAHPGKRYYVRNVYYTAEDDYVEEIITQPKYVKNTTIISKEPYDVEMLKTERDRIYDEILNQGYFTFSKGYVVMDVDSNMVGDSLDIYVRVKNPNDGYETIHKKYYMGNIYFNVDQSVSRKVDLTQIDTFKRRSLEIILPKKVIDPDAIARTIFFDTDSLYTKSWHELTLKRLNALGLFKFVNVRFEPYQISMDEGVLDTYIKGTFNKKQSFGIDLEGNTNSQNSLGLFSNLRYTNRNTFRKADRLQLDLSGGAELQFSKTDGIQNPFLNTLNLDANLKFVFPNLLLPTKDNRNLKPYKYNRTTSFNIGYNFEKRLNFYTINRTSIYFTYDWFPHSKVRHSFTPMTLGLVQPNITDAFNENLDRFPTLRRSFERQFLLGTDYTFFFNTKILNKKYNSLMLRTNVQLFGSLLYGGFSAFSDQTVKPYTIAKIPFSQFFRIENDLRIYHNFKRGGSLMASRLLIGIGAPYGNSDILPYVKQFFAGGNMSMRAWRFKTLGPGSFDISTLEGNLLDQTGDIRLEANLEYRFDIYKFIKAALFVDAGNVWLMKADSTRPGGNFDFRRFGKEIAVGAGMGIRLDFNFFVIRFDAAVPVFDPFDKWVIKDFSLSKNSLYRRRLGYNIAIGYPF